MMVSASRDADGIGVVQGDGGAGVPVRAVAAGLTACHDRFNFDVWMLAG
jgi:hypothetical protein